MILKVKARLSLKGKALQYLATREHSRDELRRKLLAYERKTKLKITGNSEASQANADQALDESGEQIASTSAVETLLAELEKANYLSETRFVQGLLHRNQGRFGPLKLAQEVYTHKVSPSLVKAALQEAKQTEFQNARLVWQKKFGATAASPQEHAKQVRFLASRGFSAQVTYQVLKNPFNTE